MGGQARALRKPGLQHPALGVQEGAWARNKGADVAEVERVPNSPMAGAPGAQMVEVDS